MLLWGPSVMLTGAVWGLTLLLMIWAISSIHVVPPAILINPIAVPIRNTAQWKQRMTCPRKPGIINFFLLRQPHLHCTSHAIPPGVVHPGEANAPRRGPDKEQWRRHQQEPSRGGTPPLHRSAEEQGVLLVCPERVGKGHVRQQRGGGLDSRRTAVPGPQCWQVVHDAEQGWKL